MECGRYFDDVRKKERCRERLKSDLWNGAALPV